MSSITEVSLLRWRLGVHPERTVVD